MQPFPNLMLFKTSLMQRMLFAVSIVFPPETGVPLQFTCYYLSELTETARYAVCCDKSLQSSHIMRELYHLEKMLPEFEALPGVVGLTLNGGLSRGYADHLSKIKVQLPG